MTAPRMKMIGNPWEITYLELAQLASREIKIASEWVPPEETIRRAWNLYQEAVRLLDALRQQYSEEHPELFVEP